MLYAEYHDANVQRLHNKLHKRDTLIHILYVPSIQYFRHQTLHNTYDRGEFPLYLSAFPFNHTIRFFAFFPRLAAYIMSTVIKVFDIQISHIATQIVAQWYFPI